ncbi:isoprenoid synthase domain-containing protein, partial [Mycena epipterygia]
GVPDGNYEKMIWACRVSTLLFLIDDELDTDVQTLFLSLYALTDHAISSSSYIEEVTNTIWRAIEAGCQPDEFKQFARLTQEFFLSHNLPPYENIDQFVAVRQVNSGAYFVFGFARYALEIRLSDEQINHPLIKACEDLVAHLLALGNDLFSYTKEVLTDSAQTNLITMLQKFEGVPSASEAILKVREAIKQREEQLVEACKAVLADEVFGKDPEVRRWMAALEYLHSGNCWWSQHV